MATSPKLQIEGLKPPNAFIIDDNVAEGWRLFKQRWETYALLTDVSKRDNEVQIALFVNCLSDDALKVYNGFTSKDTNLPDIIKEFQKFAVGETNVTYERFMFNTCIQNEGEPIEQFISKLRNIAGKCDFCPTCKESLIRDRIVLGIHDKRIQAELLKRRSLNLADCIDACRAAEAAKKQTQIIACKSEPEVNTIQRKLPRRQDIGDCRYCGGSHAPKREACPANNKKCNRCQKLNHFGKMCRSAPPAYRQSPNRNIRQIVDNDSDAEDFVYAISSGNKEIKCKLQVNGKKIPFLIDTGSSVNLLPKRFASNIRPTGKRLKMWNGTTVTPVGESMETTFNPKSNTTQRINFVICTNDARPILGLQACETLKVIQICEENFERINQAQVQNTKSTDKAIGSFPGVHKLKVTQGAQPRIMPNRRIPIAIRDAVKEELDRLTELKVIEPVSEPTPWVSQMVVAKKKNDKLRICIDPHELNKVLERERYQLPTLDDVLHELSNSRVFTKADLKCGYWHVQLDTESSYLTTFQTAFGRFRWRRLPFGLKVSAEIFQKQLHNALHDLEGIVNVADDVIIHGRTKEEHDRRLEKFMDRCKEYGIQLNEEKLVANTDKVSFMGHVISSQGLQLDPQKNSAIQNYPTPRNTAELKRFLGMINYLQRFLPDAATHAQPLQALLKKDVDWNWSEAQEAAFQRLKSQITNASTLAIYEPNAPLALENDASDYGLGSVLQQNDKPIAFASRQLTSTEQNYAQIEKEMLALVFGLTKFHQYTYGRPVTVTTDHQPLVAIVKKPLDKAPRRLRSMLLRIQEYDCDVIFKPGKSIPVADALSRAPMSDTEENTMFVSNLSLTSINSRRLAEWRAATEEDDETRTLKETILRGWPTHKVQTPDNIRAYFEYRDELTAQDGVLFRGTRLIVPKQLRPEMKKKVHAGHTGINSCIRRARQYIFWPGMSTEIRQTVETCATCNSLRYKQPMEPLAQHTVPERPWEKIGTDLFYDSGKAYLITADYFSNFFEIDELQHETSGAVIKKLKGQFARYGIPDTVISDNGPQFASQQFRDFAKEWDFEHRTSSPYNSQANGTAEAAVKVAKRLLKTCRQNKEDPKIGLLNLRNTPQEGMEKTPAQLLMGRRTKTLIPTTQQTLLPEGQTYKEERYRKENKKARTAERYTHKKELAPLRHGDIVRIQPTRDETWNKGIITGIAGPRSYIVTQSDGGNIRRNRKHLRLSKETELKEEPIEIELEQPHPIGSGVVENHAEAGETPSEANPAGGHAETPEGPSPRPSTRTRSGRNIKQPQRLNI